MFEKVRIVARTAPLPPILGGSEVEVPQNWGLKAFQVYMKRGASAKSLALLKHPLRRIIGY